MERLSFKIKEKEFLEYKKKLKARFLLNQSVRRGDLKKSEFCELCERKKITEAHHVDYGRPLEVFWLCSKCHGLAHRKGHPLNPEGIEQTNLTLDIGRNDTITVLVNIDFDTYAKIKAESEETKQPFSKIIKNTINEKFGRKDQLEFNFEEENDDSQSRKARKTNERVSSLAKNEAILSKSKAQLLQAFRSQGQKSLFSLA